MNQFFRIWIIVLCLLIGTETVRADPMDSSMQTPVPSVNQDKPEDQPKKILLAQQLIGLIGVEDQYKNMFMMVGGLMLPSIMRENPDKIDDAKNMIADISDNELHAYQERLRTQGASAYVEAYSLAELDQMVAFFKSPAGHKFVTTFRAVANKSIASNKTNMLDAVKETSQKVEENLKKNGMKVPQELHTMDSRIAPAFFGASPCPGQQCQAGGTQ